MTDFSFSVRREMSFFRPVMRLRIWKFATLYMLLAHRHALSMYWYILSDLWMSMHSTWYMYVLPSIRYFPRTGDYHEAAASYIHYTAQNMCLQMCVLFLLCLTSIGKERRSQIPRERIHPTAFVTHRGRGYSAYKLDKNFWHNNYYTLLMSNMNNCLVRVAALFQKCTIDVNARKGCCILLTQHPL